jgi:hypothetical protein
MMNLSTNAMCLWKNLRCVLFFVSLFPPPLRLGFCCHDVFFFETVSNLIPHHATTLWTDIYCLGVCLYSSFLQVLVTRYEYANLYHTMTDWYNVYQTLRIFGLPPDRTLIVFMVSLLFFCGFLFVFYRF